MIRPVALALALLTLPACGGGGGRPDPISGAHVQIFGVKSQVFSLDNTSSCLPKPGLSEFEYEGNSDAGDSFHLVLKDFKGAGSHTLEYGVTKPKHRFDIDLAGGFSYRFFQHLRSDIDKIYNSRCQVTIDIEGTGDAATYSGTVSCVLLWADAASRDFDGASLLNSFVDINAKFSCSR